MKAKEILGCFFGRFLRIFMLVYPIARRSHFLRVFVCTSVVCVSLRVFYIVRAKTILGGVFGAFFLLFCFFYTSVAVDDEYLGFFCGTSVSVIIKTILNIAVI